MAFSEEYFIHLQGVQKGPYTYPQLKRMYDNNLIPEETLYWRDGMEQLEAVSDLCGTRKRDRLRHLKQLRVTAAVVVGGAALLTAYFAPVLKVGWREMNDRDPTGEGAYWRARGFVREDVKRGDGTVSFQPYETASVTLTGTNAAVILSGTLYGRDESARQMSWKVGLGYDGEKSEWKLGMGKL